MKGKLIKALEVYRNYCSENASEWDWEMAYTEGTLDCLDFLIDELSGSSRH